MDTFEDYKNDIPEMGIEEAREIIQAAYDRVMGKQLRQPWLYQRERGCRSKERRPCLRASLRQASICISVS